MATNKSAMTPEDATAAIRDVRDYRQNLTGRAAGLVWIIWGFALALFASTDMVGALDPPEQPVTGWSTIPVPWPVMVLPFAALVAGVVATNVVWKSHALETGTRHRAWIAWVAILGLLVAIVVLGLASLGVATTTGPDSGVTFLWLMPLAGALGAVAISLLQMRRVKPWFGLGAAGFLVAIEFVVPPLLSGNLETKILGATASAMLAILAAFVTVGLLHYRRG